MNDRLRRAITISAGLGGIATGLASVAGVDPEATLAGVAVAFATAATLSGLAGIAHRLNRRRGGAVEA